MIYHPKFRYAPLPEDNSSPEAVLEAKINALSLVVVKKIQGLHPNKTVKKVKHVVGVSTVGTSSLLVGHNYLNEVSDVAPAIKLSLLALSAMFAAIVALGLQTYERNHKQYQKVQLVLDRMLKGNISQDDRTYITRMIKGSVKEHGMTEAEMDFVLAVLSEGAES